MVSMPVRFLTQLPECRNVEDLKILKMPLYCPDQIKTAFSTEVWHLRFPHERLAPSVAARELGLRAANHNAQERKLIAATLQCSLHLSPFRGLSQSFCQGYAAHSNRKPGSRRARSISAATAGCLPIRRILLQSWPRFLRTGKGLKVGLAQINNRWNNTTLSLKQDRGHS